MFEQLSDRSRMVVLRYFVFNACVSLVFFGAVLVPMYTEWARLPKGTVNFIQGWFMVWMFVLDVPTGAFADRFGRKLSMMLGLVVSTCGLLLYGSYPHLGVFLVGEFLLALGSKLMSGADQALVYAMVPEVADPALHAQLVRRTVIVRRVAMIVGAPLGSLIAWQWGYNFPMILSALPMLLGLLVVRGFQEVHEGHRPLMWESVRVGWQEVRHNMCVRSLMLQMMVSSVPGYFTLWLYQLLLMRLMVSTSVFGLVHAMLVVAQLVVLALFGWLVRKIGSVRRYLVVASLATTASYLLAAFWHAVPSALLFVVVSGGFALTRNDLLRGYVNPHVRKEYQATVVSYIGMMTSLLLIFMNALVGILVDYSFEGTMMMVALFPLLAMIVLPKEACFERK